ncbi:hypothetical protein K1719_034293 [Acacia pycnantha]|nr:hypothetical protein K1719_034293 [Acacia pycnantha]
MSGDIPNEISNLTNVNNIYLDENQLSGPIPKSIGKLTMLKELSLANNNLEGNIPNEIRGLANLKIIDLSVNQLFGHIPRGIGNLTILQEVILERNNLEVASSSINMYSLSLLSLSYEEDGEEENEYNNKHIRTNKRGKTKKSCWPSHSRSIFKRWQTG